MLNSNSSVETLYHLVLYKILVVYIHTKIDRIIDSLSNDTVSQYGDLLMINRLLKQLGNKTLAQQVGMPPWDLCYTSLFMILMLQHVATVNK